MKLREEEYATLLYALNLAQQSCYEKIITSKDSIEKEELKNEMEKIKKIEDLFLKSKIDFAE